MAYRASANGRIQRVHRTLNTLLGKRVNSKTQEDWDEHSSMMVAACNASQHENTHISPFYSMFDCVYRTLLDLTIAVSIECIIAR